jgi:preprotein translocase subunit SecA
MYQKLAGMTGTAETEAREFWEIYKLDVSGDPDAQAVRAQGRRTTSSTAPSARSTTR